MPVLSASPPFPRVWRLEAAQREIPAIPVEIGDEAHCDPTGVTRMAQGLRNVVPQLGMIEEPLEGIPKACAVVKAPPDGELSHRAMGGFIRNQSAPGEPG